jgi:hypothetical protein
MARPPMRQPRRRSVVARRRAAGWAAAAAAGVLLFSGCTTTTELRPGAREVEFTSAWADADIAQVPDGAIRMSRYELHDEVDPLLHDPSGVRRTAYVMTYLTPMEREQVIDYYLDRFGDRWRFAPVDPDRALRLKAHRDGVAAEIRLVTLVHGADELPEIRAPRTDVTVIMSDWPGRARERVPRLIEYLPIRPPVDPSPYDRIQPPPLPSPAEEPTDHGMGMDLP